MKLPEGRQIGFIAQDLLVDFSELVKFNEELDIYTVNYSQFSAVLVEAFKEQQLNIKKNQEMFQILHQGVY